ncbi:MAG: CYTH and CHAD domain-containing protein [Alphaproteobacteria bacterium]|nr:CYTH and CHAD domain-containing protein [Alphaproteobacteria bacterium]
MAPVSAQKRLVSTYYDTPEATLKERGLTLRVRDQDGHFIQTVKSGDLAEGDLLSRGEWEDAVTENRPDPIASQSGPHLPEDATGELRPVFVTEVSRTTFAIEPAPGTAVEAAIDQGVIRAVDKNGLEPISEVELELKGGESSVLYDLAAQLLKVAPLRLEARSKSERGYHLVEHGNAPPSAVHAEPVELDRDMTVMDALQNIGRSCLAQLLRNEPAVLSGQPEGVHQMRVAVRRLRSAISSFRELLPGHEFERTVEELRWLGGMLGPVRNLDVFTTELLPQGRLRLPDQPGWDDLAATLDRLRNASYDQLRDAIESQRYTTGMLRLLQRFETPDSSGQQGLHAGPPIGELVPRMLDRRRRKVRRRSAGFGHLAPPERHKLRIAVKKLRYTVELFGNLFDKTELQGYVKRLKGLQGDLGYANDVRVAHEFVTELFAQIEPRSADAHAWVALLEAHDQKLAGGERKMRRNLRKLNEARPFWHQ